MVGDDERREADVGEQRQPLAAEQRRAGSPPRSCAARPASSRASSCAARARPGAPRAPRARPRAWSRRRRWPARRLVLGVRARALAVVDRVGRDVHEARAERARRGREPGGGVGVERVGGGRVALAGVDVGQRRAVHDELAARRSRSAGAGVAEQVERPQRRAVGQRGDGWTSPRRPRTPPSTAAPSSPLAPVTTTRVTASPRAPGARRARRSARARAPPAPPGAPRRRRARRPRRPAPRP